MSAFGPIECHHLVSFYKKTAKFKPQTTKLKKSQLKHLSLSLGFDPIFLHVADLSIISTFPQSRAKRGWSPNFTFESTAKLTQVYHLEHLLRRGLGYRIIFNMGGKVYNPEDPSTLPDVTFVITDTTGSKDLGQLVVPEAILEKNQAKIQEFLGLLSGCHTIETVYKANNDLIIKRDGKVELEFFHFDKLLSPEQLKIYNKYASVLGVHHPSYEANFSLEAWVEDWMNTPRVSEANQLLVNFFQGSPMATDTIFMAQASMPVYTERYIIIISGNAIVLKPRATEELNVKIPLPAEFLAVPTPPAPYPFHKLDITRPETETQISTKQQESEFTLKVLSNQMVLVSRNRAYLKIDLDLLYQKASKIPREGPFEETWSSCSIMIQEPFVPALTPDEEETAFYQGPSIPFYHASRRSILWLRNEKSPAGNRIELYCKDISGGLSASDWVSLSLREGDTLDRSDALVALYQSASTGQIFVAIKMNEQTQSKFQFYICRFNAESKELRLEHTSKQTVDFLKGEGHRSTFWLEKKGRVFFYCVQSSPEIKLLVICYHNNKFIPLGPDNGMQTLDPEVRCFPASRDFQDINSVFGRANRKICPETGKHRLSLYLLTPDF